MRALTAERKAEQPEHNPIREQYPIRPEVDRLFVFMDSFWDLYAAQFTDAERRIADDWLDNGNRRGVGSLLATYTGIAWLAG